MLIGQPLQTATILAVLEGGSLDEELLRLACTIAKQRKSLVYAIYTIEVPLKLPLEKAVPEETIRSEEAVECAFTSAEKLGFEIEAEIVQTRDAGATIVDEAEARRATLIIIGRDYHTKLGHFDLGRAIPYVLEKAKCRVWVIRGQFPS